MCKLWRSKVRKLTVEMTIRYQQFQVKIEVGITTGYVQKYVYCISTRAGCVFQRRVRVPEGGGGGDRAHSSSHMILEVQAY